MTWKHGFLRSLTLLPSFTGMCIRTTNVWSWPVVVRRSWTAGRRRCCWLESILRKSLFVLWPFLEPSSDRTCTFQAYALLTFASWKPGRNPFPSHCVPPSIPLPKWNSPPPLPSHSFVGSPRQHSWSMMSHQYVCVFSSVSNQFFHPSPLFFFLHTPPKLFY